MQYGPEGRLDVVVETMGRPISYQYDEDGKLVSVRDFSNPLREWKFSYDVGIISPDPERETHLLTSVETPKPLPSDTSGRITRYEYENLTDDPTQLSRLNLKNVTDPRGNKFLQNQYDVGEDKLIVQQYGKAGENIIFNYEDDPSTTVVTDRRGNVTEYGFGAGVGDIQNNLLTEIIEETETGPLTTLFSGYSVQGLLLSSTLPGGDLITQAYEKSELDQDDGIDFRDRGNLLESNYKGVHETGAESETPLTNKSTYKGTFNIQESVTDPAGHVTKATDFKTKGSSSLQLDPKKIEFEEGVIEDSDYNDFGQLTKTLDAEEHENAYEYYPETSPATVRAGTNGQTGGYLRFRKLDVAGENLIWEYFYDDRGNVIEVKDPRGISTLFKYNALDELIERNDGFPEINARVRILYDTNGNTIEVSSERESELFSSVKYEYGILNQVEKKLEQVDSGELETAYVYDRNYNLTELTYPEGNKVSYVYDKRDNRIQENVASGTPAQRRTFFNYDGNRNLVSIIDDHNPPHSTVFVYDNEDRQIATVYSEGNVSERTYDDDGLVTSE